MFAVLFVLAMILLVAVSYLAIKFYRASLALDEDNKLKDGVIAALSEDFETMLAQRDNHRRRVIELGKKNSDMETALNIALQESMPEQVQIVPVVERNRIRMQPVMAGSNSLPRIPGVAPNPMPKTAVAGGKLWIEDPKTGEMFDISNIMESPAPTMKAEQVFDFTEQKSFDFTVLETDDELREAYEAVFGKANLLPPVKEDED